MSASQTAHAARLVQAQMTKKGRRPQGNYTHDAFQWGVVQAIHPASSSGPACVDIYLNGTQNDTNNNLTTNVAYVASYYPTVGDTVLVQRGMFRNRTSRVVIGKLYGTPSPYPLPLGNIDPDTNRYVTGPGALWGGTGAPSSLLGSPGDYYFRTDAQTSGEQIYQNVAGTWESVGGASASTTQASQTYSVSGTLQVASGATGYLPPFYLPVPGTGTLDLVRASVRSGSASIEIHQNGSSIGTCSVTTTPNDTLFGVTVANNDAFAPVVASVSSADGLSLSFYFTTTY